MANRAPKRRRFVEEYLIDLNGTQAAIRAGYSARTAAQTASRLLSDVKIQAEIAKAQERAAKRNEVTIDRIIEEYRRIAFADTTQAIFIRDGHAQVADTESLPPEVKAAISEIAESREGIRIKFHSKTHALDALGKHLGMFVERAEVKVETKPDMSALSDADIAALRAVANGNGDS